MIPENFEICPLITAAVLEFPVIASRSPVIPKGCIITNAKTQETFSKTVPVNMLNPVSCVVTNGYRLLIRKTQETPGEREDCAHAEFS
jgi:hypothetical protein